MRNKIRGKARGRFVTFGNGTDGKCLISFTPGKFKNFPGQWSLKEIFLGARASGKDFSPSWKESWEDKVLFWIPLDAVVWLAMPGAVAAILAPEGRWGSVKPETKSQQEDGGVERWKECPWQRFTWSWGVEGKRRNGREWVRKEKECSWHCWAAKQSSLQFLIV